MNLHRNRDVSVILLCKGRLKYLKKTLPYVLCQQGILFDVWVVDYGSPDGLSDWLTSLCYSNLYLIRVNSNTRFINRSHGRNIGAVLSAGRYLMFQDTEIYAPDFFLDYLYRLMRSTKSDLAIPCQPRKHKQGTCMMTRRMFCTVRGFDESFSGWGSEEDDLYERISRAGGKTVLYPSTLVNHIPHPDKERTQFDPGGADVSIWSSQSINIRKKRAKRITGETLANPSGVGVCDYEIVCCRSGSRLIYPSVDVS